jgi:hypothetical protein
VLTNLLNVDIIPVDEISCKSFLVVDNILWWFIYIYIYILPAAK